MPYGVAYAIKMSKRGPREIEGYFDFVVPPVEGFWWHDCADVGIGYARKDDFNFIPYIRLPDSVTREDFDWAVSEAAAKKEVGLLGGRAAEGRRGSLRSMHARRALRRRTGDHKRHALICGGTGICPRLLRIPPPSRDLSLRPAQVRAGEAQDRGPPSHQVDVAERVTPLAPAFGVYQLAVRDDRVGCPASRQARNSFSRFVSRCALCSSCGPEL